MRLNSSSVFQDYRALFICKKGTVILVGVVLKSKARNTRGITLSSFFSFFFTLITKNHRTICFLQSGNNFKRSRLKGGQPCLQYRCTRKEWYCFICGNFSLVFYTSGKRSIFKNQSIWGQFNKTFTLL